MLHAAVKAEDLAEFIFVANRNNAKLEIDFSRLGNCKELFLFLVDLVCKGLILLYSPEKRSIELDTVTNEQFHFIASKFKPAGIDLVLKVSENSAQLPTSVEISPIFDEIQPFTPLESISLCITNPQIIYEISFHLTHFAII